MPSAVNSRSSGLGVAFLTHNKVQKQTLTFNLILASTLILAYIYTKPNSSLSFDSVFGLCVFEFYCMELFLCVKTPTTPLLQRIIF